MAVTTIREIRNNTAFRVTVRNLEDPADTADGRGDLGPDEVRRAAGDCRIQRSLVRRLGTERIRQAPYPRRRSRTRHFFHLAGKP